MAKAKPVFECSTCGDQVPKWIGRCNGCGHWNTLVETFPSDTAYGALDAAVPGEPARPATEVGERSVTPVPTGIGEFDRVLGGGLVSGSTTLVGGEPGVGKSTLLGQVASARAHAGDPVLYVSAEESVDQVCARLRRLGRPIDNLWVGGEPSLDRILADIGSCSPRVVVIDSIQTIFDPQLASAPGSVGQVRHCASQLARAAKDTGAAVVLVGQVTKDGNLAGPRVLEHLVDTVVSFDGDRDFGLRLLRAIKHRFGATGEIGVLEMTGQGLVEVGDPSGMLLSDRHCDVPGSAITVAVEGRRPLVVELQALVADSATPVPLRSAQGLDRSRLSMLLAVLTQRAGVGMARRDVYASVIGGVRLSEPGIDLGVACAVVSSIAGIPIPSDVIVLGEIGLAGEVRTVPLLERRLSEAARLGFAKAIVPAGTAVDAAALQCRPVQTVAAALDVCFGRDNVIAFPAPPASSPAMENPADESAGDNGQEVTSSGSRVAPGW